ncbi:MAG TPA: DNA alkylation repair protein [Spirochaetota bacterium]|nr:DNA alkylation repair protein [Spirochaetota bacterium]
MSITDSIKKALSSCADPKKAAHLQRFFRTGPGEYGEGDRFLGIKVPDGRAVAKRYYKDVSFNGIGELLESEIHEHRLTALFMLVLKFEKSRDETEKARIIDLYLKYLDRVNNWDLVDSSAPKILGAWLFDKDRALLYELARTGHLWRQRAAVLSTFYFIKHGDFSDALQIAELLLGHPHDLIHKAAGWMLREIGNRDRETEEAFLKKHYKKMPRTMLRYAIEKFEPEIRSRYLNGSK